MVENLVNLIDTHAHVTDDRLWSEIDHYMIHARRCGLVAVININTDRITLERGQILQEKYPWSYNAGATTPHDVEKWGKRDFSFFEKAAREGKLIAIGETGLDYHYEHADRGLQKEFLRRYLRLARETQLPVIIHCREAFQDLFSIADEEYCDAHGKYLPGVLHCFTGTLDEAQHAIQKGWYISFSGIVTFKNSHALRHILSLLPLTSLVIETDSPYLAPQSKRGMTNHPSFVREVAEVIARILGQELAFVTESLCENSKKLFKLKI